MRPATTIAGHCGESAWRPEFDGGTECITDGKAKEGSTLAIGRQHPNILPAAEVLASRDRCIWRRQVHWGVVHGAEGWRWRLGEKA